MKLGKLRKTIAGNCLHLNDKNEPKLVERLNNALLLWLRYNALTAPVVTTTISAGTGVKINPNPMSDYLELYVLN